MKKSSNTLQNFVSLLKDKKRIVIAAALGMILISLAIFLVLNSGKQNSSDSRNNGAAPVVFKDWLKPAAEIKVGTNRYLSACQILPLNTVSETMFDGMPPQELAVSEKYYDASLVQERLSRPKTSCEYGQAVILKTEQYFETSDVKNLARSVSQVGYKNLDSKIAAYERAANESNDADAKQFVSQLKASVKTYNEKKGDFSGDTTKNLDTNTLVIPSGFEAMEFTLFSNNVVYELVLPSELSPSALTDAPNDQLVTMLKQSKKLTDAIHKNSKNAQLSQSPGRTILSNSPRVGKTYVVEPCAVLTATIMKSITGIEQSNNIERRSLPYDLAKINKSKAGNAIYPKNQCGRSVKDGTERVYTQTTVRLEIEHAPNSAAMDKRLTDEEFLPLDADDTQLQTTADFAAEYNVTGFPPFYRYRVGAYWVNLSMTTINTDRQQGQLSREQHVSAINLLTDSLKANIKEAESTQGR